MFEHNKPNEHKRLNKQNVLGLRLGIIYKVFTPLEMMRQCSAAGSGSRIIAAEFDPPLEFLTG
jgi:hypothetical protein